MDKAKIIFASDFAPIRNFAPLLSSAPEAVYGDLLPVIKSADYRIVNLESPLDPADGFITKSGAVFSGEPEHISSLSAAGFNAAICANNHTFDCDVKGFLSTTGILHKAGIATVGAGMDIKEARRPLEIEVNGIKIMLFTISEGEDMRGAGENTPGVRPWEVEILAEEIRQAKGSCDAIIVSAHCGLEYQPYPSFYVYEAFRCWAEAGADIIIGHHPHVPQGMTTFGKVPAYFSLGNFVFYQPLPLFYRKMGYMLELEVGKGGILSHRPVPYRIGDSGLSLLKGKDKQEFDGIMEKISAPLCTPEGALRAWHAVLAYNGTAGFRAELENILKTLRETPAKGAAMLRNRLLCVQHSTQWLDGYSRIVDGTIDDAPEELVEVVRDYMTRKVVADEADSGM